MKVWNEKEFKERLKQGAEQEEIPQSLHPEQMEQFLKEQERKKKPRKRYWKWYGALAVAACFVLLVFAEEKLRVPEPTSKEAAQDGKETSVQKVALEEVSYEKLYDYFKERRVEKEEEYQKKYGEKESAWAADGIVREESSQMDTGNTDAEKSMDYGQTNQQEDDIEEADIVKNDGRYLYQVITQQDYTQAVQIADTKEGLRETARITGFASIDSIYIHGEQLIILEQGYTEVVEESTPLARGTGEVACDIDILGNPYVKISIYSIKDRSNPREEHSFTVQGSYLDSRVSDGYFYCFLNRRIDVPKNAEEYDDYIPILDGKKVEESSIYLPKDAQAEGYVLLVSIDLKHPNELKDTKAIVSGGTSVYVTEENIYILDNWWPDNKEKGQYSNRTTIFRFSYQGGMIKKEAEGSVKGLLLDDMAVNEADGYLRVVTTVESYQVKEIKDEILDIVFGYDTSERKISNSLYVLDDKLKIAGKIENLAEEEQVYSARFMGNMGFFVTFRQTDPLFSVDLSDPKNPKILGELKISGFSEYLHFYSEDLLLGIGMEAEEDTGRTQGMKLSMFDISNPSDVKEQDQYPLSQYNYSEALYNYKGVLIDTQKNLFGFSAEGYQDDKIKKEYLLFSYDSEHGRFVEKMKISLKEENRISTRARGTYIGEIFYVMYGDGRIESYSLETGEQQEIMEPSQKAKGRASERNQ